MGAGIAAGEAMAEGLAPGSGEELGCGAGAVPPEHAASSSATLGAALRIADHPAGQRDQQAGGAVGAESGKGIVGIIGLQRQDLPC